MESGSRLLAATSSTRLRKINRNGCWLLQPVVFTSAPRQSVRLEEQAFTRVETGSGAPDTTGSVRAIIQFRGATYFAIYGRGIDRMDGGRSSLTWSNTAATAREVLSLLADGEERLLIGTTETACSSPMEKRFVKNPPLRR